MVQKEDEAFRIRVLEKENRDLKAVITNLKVDNEEFRQQVNQLKDACKILTKEKGIKTADQIPLDLTLDPIEYIKQWNKGHIKQ